MKTSYPNQVENANLRQEVYSSLERTGCLDQIKSQLRTTLIQQINADSEKTKQSKSKENNAIVKTLSTSDHESVRALRLSLSLITDFMKKYNLNYTLSVFTPECGGVNDLYNDSELSHTLQISFENILKTRENSFLNLMTKKYLQVIQGKISYSNNVGCQTDSSNSSTDFDQRMKDVDKKFANNVDLEKLMPAKAFEEKMMKFQKECELRMRSDLQNEVKVSHKDIS